MQDMPETRYAKSGDVHIAYQVFGQGTTDLVFLSSWISQIEHIWAWPQGARFYSRLARFSRVIALDKRGAGLSDRVSGTPAIDERMDDIRAVMDAVGSERAALLGTSEGGALGAVFAASHPDRTTALIMANSGARFSAAPDYPWGWTEEAGDVVVTYIGDYWGSGLSVPLVAPDFAGDEDFRRWFGQLERLSGTPGVMRATWRWNMDIDIREILPVIRVPTLVLSRVGDPLVPVESGRYLGSHIPGATYVELPGSEHYAFFGDVDGMVDEVEQFLTGTKAAPEADRMLATVLFTDIVDSTAQAATVGDRRWHTMLEQYYGLVREKLHAFRGREVKLLGDGVLATFDGPGRAIRCAVAIRDAVPSIGVAVRSGLHTGEVEVMDEDIGGIGVHIGQRVCALARPSEVLVSRTVVDLVAGAEIAFTDRGEHDLKGVPGTWRLFAAEG